MERMDFVFLRVATQPVTFFNCFQWDDEQQVREVLRGNPDFLLSVFLASPQLLVSLEAYINSEIPDPALLKTICKYVARNSHRATPFGNFSAVGVADYGERTEIRDIAFHLHTELDIYIRQKLFERLQPEPRILFSNNSLFQGPVYSSYFELINGEYRLSRIKNSRQVGKILALAKNGIPNKQLTDRYGPELIDDMIREQLLFSRCKPTVFEKSSAWLNTLLPRVSTEWVGFLRELAEKLALPEKSLADLGEVSGMVAGLTGEPNTFYANCSFETSVCTLNHAEIEGIQRTLNELDALFVRSEPPLLTEFKKKFYERYGDAEVSLLVALDPETGIAYGRRQEYGYETFLDNRGIRSPDTGPDLRLFPLQKALWTRAVRQNLQVVELDPGYLSPPGDIRYPETQYALGELLEGGRFLLKNIGGASAHTLLARFGGLSPRLDSTLSRIIEAEGPAVDLVYLPPGREGNVCLQVPSGRYQMPYLTLGDENSPQMDIGKVYLSVKDGREIALRAGNQSITVRIPNAHNYHRGLPVYRFLGDLQFQGNTTNFTWNWGPLADEPFLPRVVYKNLILCKATWNVDKDEDFEEILRRLPEEVTLVQADNELYLDLRVNLCRVILQEELKKEGA